MEAYWLAFAGFFFGLTYGLLQVVTEVPILRREHQSGVSDAAYLASKVALLAPLLMVVNAAMLVVLRVLDRLPDLDARTWVSLSVTLGINAVVALFLGLLASAAVTSVAQAALALPMLCFPAVLFSGAMVPVPVMTTGGRRRWLRRCPTAGPSRRSPGTSGSTGSWSPTRRTPTSATRRTASTGPSSWSVELCSPSPPTWKSCSQKDFGWTTSCSCTWITVELRHTSRRFRNAFARRGHHRLARLSEFKAARTRRSSTGPTDSVSDASCLG